MRGSSPKPKTVQRASSGTANDQLLTLAAVLEELDVPKATFFRWKAIGIAPKTIKFPNGTLRIRRSELDQWIRQHEEQIA